MFLTFQEKEQRWKNSTNFIEFQYCKLRSNAKLKKIVAVRSIHNWDDDSLYVLMNDSDDFCSNYGEIIDGGVYSDLKSGRIDLFGINYYSPEKLKEIIKKVEDKKPSCYEILLEWLKQGINYNGFYILGL